MQELDSFNVAPPGHSLTHEKGAWDWDSPPRFTDPNDAMGYIIEELEDPDVEENYIKLLFAGVSIEEIVQSIAMAGFSSGYYTPDVAEIIKMPLAIYFMGLAEENKVPARVFMDTEDGGPPKQTMDDDSLLQIMKKRNPQVYSLYMDEFHKREDKLLRPETGMLDPTIQNEGDM